MHRLALALLILLSLAAPCVAADAFVDGLDDLPLMEGLAGAGDPAVFDAAQGRVVESMAEGTPTRAAVLAFYAATLPQLGWRVEGAGRFAREGERLLIEFPPATSGRTLVRFYLSPE
ncbi:MAG: hypothetical protein GC202_13870 [Alphaproteobacteria bacterium]|nr:hypothetical protein [Alphaproteobacteria bacterium]